MVRSPKNSKKAATNAVKIVGEPGLVVAMCGGEAVRLQHWKALNKLTKEVEKESAALKQFVNSDGPKYNLWLETEFGNKISALQVLGEEIENIDRYIQQIHLFADAKKIAVYKSCSILDLEKEKGTLDEFWRQFSEEQRTAFFKKHPHRTSDTSEDSIDFEDEDDELDSASDEMDEDLFEEFEEMFGMLFGEEEYESADPRSNKDRKINFKKAQGTFQEKSDGNLALKSLYRKIVHKLHPDLNQEQTPEMRQLFLDSVACYEDEDISGLESIWKKLEGDEAAIFNWKTGPISEIMKRCDLISDKLDSIRWETLQAKRSPFWGFTSKMASPNKLKSLKQKIEKELTGELAVLEMQRNHANRDLQKIRERGKPSKHGTKSTKGKGGAKAVKSSKVNRDSRVKESGRNPFHDTLFSD